MLILTNHIVLVQNNANILLPSGDLMATGYSIYSINHSDRMMEKLILTLLLDIKSFFYERFPGTVQFETGFRGLSDDEFVEFEIRISGLVINDEQKETIDAINYNDSEPSHTGEFTVLQKVKDTVSKLHGRLHFSVLSKAEIVVHVLIPQQAASQKTGD